MVKGDRWGSRVSLFQPNGSEYHFIRVHEYLVQHLSYNISIILAENIFFFREAL